MEPTPELTLSRTVDAPRELVWKVWTEAEHLARWWGPAGFEMAVTRLDLRVGGRFLYSMTPPGTDRQMFGLFEYDEVTPVERLVFRSGFADEVGAFAPNPMASAWPLQIRNTLTLEARGDKTLLTLHGVPHEASLVEQRTFAENTHNIQQGFAGTFAQLDAYLAEALTADRAITYRRTFDAPRDVVWKAWTQPARIAAWWGPSGFGNTVHAMDVRPGGRWTYTMHGPDGTDWPNVVSYLEVEAPSRLVYDHGDPENPKHFQVTVNFAETAGRTVMVYRMVFPTKEARDLVVAQHGAEEGLRQNMDRFAAWLTKSGLVLTRVFEAPRSLVWRAWTDPAQLQRWWGPEHFTCPGATVDLRKGGKYLLGMQSADGQQFWSTGVYEAVEAPERLVYTDNFADAQGNVVPASALGLPGEWPERQLVTVTFDELGPGKTLVTVHQEALPADWMDMTLSGWSTSFDKLAKVLK